jgi:hypothetical protein
MFQPLKSFFLSQDAAPKTLLSFFENEMAEVYLYFVHSQMPVFQKAILMIEKEKNSVAEVHKILLGVVEAMKNRREAKFLSLTIKSMLSKVLDTSARKQFDDDITSFYETCVIYLEKRTSNFSSFQCFQWMLLDKSPEWSDIEDALTFLQTKNIIIDDTYLFDEFANLKKFVCTQLDSDDWPTSCCSDKWVRFFNSVPKHSANQLYKIAQFYFSIPCHNANVERIFSLMTGQWTDDRSRFLVSTMKSVLTVKFNFSEMNCKEFFKYLQGKPKLLQQIASSSKYNEIE